MTQATATKIPYNDAELQRAYDHIDRAFGRLHLDPTNPDDVAKALKGLASTRPDNVTDEDADKLYTYAQRHLPKAIYTAPATDSTTDSTNADVPSSEVQLTDDDAGVAHITAQLAVMMGLPASSFPSYDALEKGDGWGPHVKDQSPEYKEAYRLEILRQFNLQGGK